MSSPLFRYFQLSDTDANRDWQLSPGTETYQATIVLPQTLPDDWGGVPADLLDESERASSPRSLSRESVRIAWEAEASPGPPPAEDGDPDVVEAYARSFALARFARRVIDGDPHAWIEAMVSYWGRIPLPFDVSCGVAVEEGLAIRIAVDLPRPSGREHAPRGSRIEQTRYAETCCRLVLTLAEDVFRILPAAADLLYVTASREEVNPATGHPRRAILLRLATDRTSLSALNLAAVTPSAAFENLGGAFRRDRFELVPVAYEEADDRST
jgi:hypothetical protein